VSVIASIEWFNKNADAKSVNVYVCLFVKFLQSFSQQCLFSSAGLSSDLRVSCSLTEITDYDQTLKNLFCLQMHFHCCHFLLSIISVFFRFMKLSTLLYETYFSLQLFTFYGSAYLLVISGLSAADLDPLCLDNSHTKHKFRSATDCDCVYTLHGCLGHVVLLLQICAEKLSALCVCRQIPGTGCCIGFRGRLGSGSRVATGERMGRCFVQQIVAGLPCVFCFRFSTQTYSNPCSHWLYVGVLYICSVMVHWNWLFDFVCG